MSKEWTQVGHISVSSQDMQSNPEEFNNLQGDLYDYMIYGVGYCSTAVNVLFRANNDSGSNYRDYDMEGTSTTASAGVTETDTNMALFDVATTSNYQSLIKATFTGSSSNERVIDVFTGTKITNGFVRQSSQFWKNTSDELASINLVGSSTNTITADFYLFSKPKQGVFNAEDWEIVEKYEFSAVNLNTSPKTFSNLQGDVDEEYMFEAQIDSLDSGSLYQLYAQLNSDASAINTEQRLSNANGTLSASTNSTRAFTYLSLASTGEANSSLEINAKSGEYRTSIMSSGALRSGSTVQTEIVSFYRNTADEITNIKVYDSQTGNTITGTITLYKRSKFKASNDAHEVLIEEYDISGDFSSGYTFKNLKGETDGLYKVVCSELKSSADISLRMQINRDVGSNYEEQFLRGTATTASAATTIVTYFPIGYVSSDYPGKSEMYIYPKTGKYRPALLKRGGELSSAYHIDLYSFWWQNTADAIEEIKVYSSASTAMTGKVSLYKVPFLDFAIPNWGAVSQWLFTGNALDSTGSNDGTLQGNAAISGGVLDLDGTGDYASVADNATLDPTVVSISAWVKFNSVASTQMIVAKRNATDRSYYLYYNASGTKLQFKVRLSGTPTEFDCEADTTTPGTGTWYHIVATYDNGSNNKIYINAVDETQVNVNDGGAVPNVTSPVYIGSHSAGSEALNGNMSRVAIFNTALSSAEVSEIYNYEKKFLL